MEAIAPARGAALPVSSSSQLTRRDRQSARNSTNEVNQARDPVDVNYCSVPIDDNVDNGILRQKLHDVGKQREELQRIEVELRAQFLARSEIVDMQKSFDTQIKEHAIAKTKLQEQLRGREQKIAELEKMMEEKEREMHVLRLDTKAAWAKEGLLREQNLELQTYRRERDSSEAERAQHINQIHDLQEHFQEKERQFLELQEQNKIAQETILIKDEQLREAQNWITRVQEMDVLKSSTHHTLQAELRERTELYNQLWLSWRQQYGELERLHLYIQQIQLELADAREKNGIRPDSSRGDQPNSREMPLLEQNSGIQVDSNGNNVSVGNPNVPKSDNAENPSLVSVENPSTQVNHPNGVQMTPSLFGFPSYPPAGQMAALHPFVIHQQVPSNIHQTNISHLHPIPAPQEKQQTSSESIPTNDQYPLQNDPGMLRSESNYGGEISKSGNMIRPDYLDANYRQSMESDNTGSSLNKRREVFETIDKSYSVTTQSQDSIQQMSSQFHEALKLDLHEHNPENKEKNLNHLGNLGVEPQGLMNEEPNTDTKLSPSEISARPVNFSSVTMNGGSAVVVPEEFSSTGKRSHHVVRKLVETPLLDEKPLLACIARTIPPGSGGRIRISSTLPNRLGKMLAPLHWHDYKKKYGKLDEFVAGHPELFVIEGDYIQLREGAQEIIAATAAVAKVAAATAATISHSQHLPSVAVTPLAQPHRLKTLSTESTSSGKTNTTHLDMQNQHSKGNSFHFAGGSSNAKVVSKPKDRLEPNGSESRSIYSVGLNGTNGTNTFRKELGASPSKVSANGGRVAGNVIGRQQGRAIGPTSTSGRYNAAKKSSLGSRRWLASVDD